MTIRELQKKIADIVEERIKDKTDRDFSELDYFKIKGCIESEEVANVIFEFLEES